jgi:biopolymer transport protein ExbB
MFGILQFIKGGGVIMYPLLLISMIAVAVIIERLIAFAQAGKRTPGLLANVLRLCTAGQYKRALELCEAGNGPLAASLATVLHHRNLGVLEVERLVEETSQEYFMQLERLLPLLDTATTISPLLGLLGTLTGMIGTFNAIAAVHAQGNTDAILGGVGEALYATATGLTIAVICFIAYNYFTARLNMLVSETEQGATKLMNLLTGNEPKELSDCVEGGNGHALPTAKTA